MGLIANEIVAQVLERSDIVELISGYVVLKRAGRNFKALCPFHHEKSSSFVVSPDKQIFHCFGCGAGGNAIGFVMMQEKLEFPEAVRFLAEKAGVVIAEINTPKSPSALWKDEVLKLNGLAVEYFHLNLLSKSDPDVKNARDYLKDRGVRLEDVKQFKLGFSMDEWDGLLNFLKSAHVDLKFIERSGLVIARENKQGYYDRFRDRIVFPIFDVKSQCVGFGARTMKDEKGAKYINSPDTPAYTKGHHLFGLHVTRHGIVKKDQAIIVEGYMDMIIPYQFGVDNIVASLGTALTNEQIRLLHRYTNNVVMLFDSDVAGQAAIVRNLDVLIEQGMNVRVAS
ncbi:MAG: DNA primase, partial [Candidatus Omnitrophica bacterium]|nr:DNA primase [Candidatus Omnitrophota bacterium]